jgi:hypothetical protein
MPNGSRWKNRWLGYWNRFSRRKNEAMSYKLTGPTGAAGIRTTQRVREAVEKACNNPKRVPGLPPLQVVTVDHYNTKWAVPLIEWVRRRRIADHIISRPRRVCIQVLEAGMLPRGRFLFYNGVGGAVADMVAHLMQPLRALAGYATVKEMLAAMRVVQIKRARYNLKEGKDGFVSEAFGAGTIEQDELASKLTKDTETFGVMELEFIGSPWNGTHVYIRTGKGILPQSKTIIVEGFDDDGPAALIFDIDNKCAWLANHKELSTSGSLDRLPAHRWMRTQEFHIPGLTATRPLQPRPSEYVEAFSALCDWESPDPRFFPPVDEAAYVCDFFYQQLLRDRTAYPQGLQESDNNVYPSNYSGGQVLSWLTDKAGW